MESAKMENLDRHCYEGKSYRDVIEAHKRCELNRAEALVMVLGALAGGYYAQSDAAYVVSGLSLEIERVLDVKKTISRLRRQSTVSK
jgi:hypothetical protein